MRFLKKGSEYNKIYRNHKKVRGSFYTLLYQFDKSSNEPAVGIIVSKKTGKAVVRNKIKRRVRAFFRENVKLLPENLQGVVIAAADAGGSDWKATAADLQFCIKRATGEQPGYKV